MSIWETALLEGAVEILQKKSEVSLMKLKPGDMARLSKNQLTKEKIPASFLSSNRPIAVEAPFFGLRIKGRKNISVRGSNHLCIVMISVETIPGSAALTVIPFSRSCSDSSKVNNNKANFVLL